MLRQERQDVMKKRGVRRDQPGKIELLHGPQPNQVRGSVIITKREDFYLAAQHDLENISLNS